MTNLCVITYLLLFCYSESGDQRHGLTESHRQPTCFRSSTMPTFDNIEEYLAYVEEYFFYSVNAVTHSLPDVNEVVNQLWVDISRYGPGMPAFPEVHVPSLGDFQVPPPPPPPPPEPSSWVGQTADWAARHPWKTSGIVASIVGAGLLVGYRDRVGKRARHIYHRKRSQSPDSLQIVGKCFYHNELSTPYVNI